MKNKAERRRTPALVRFALWILLSEQRKETEYNQTARNIAASTKTKDLARLAETMKCAEMMRRGR